MMISNRERLTTKLAELPDVELALYKDSDLLCVYFKGKEFAHFHTDPEIDVRMSQKFIRKLKLGPAFESANHPNRSKNSRWRVIPFHSAQDVDNIVQLIETLVNEEYQTE